METVGIPPLIELGAPILGEPEKWALCAVIDDGWLSMGPRVRQFELAFAEMHSAEDAVAVNSGTSALQLALAAFDIGPGDEVLVPSLTFVATASVVLHVGATPVFVDIEAPGQPHMSLEDARSLITHRTRAIVVMHYGGYAVDVARWRELADEFGLLLFEDAAHTAGLTGVVGTRSDAASFSFFANKNMTTAEGGMVIVPDEARRARIRLLRAHGMTRNGVGGHRPAYGYDVVECGHNHRMDELRAAVGLAQLQRLPEWNARRQELSARYRQVIEHELPEVVVPFEPKHETTAHLQPVLLPAGSSRPEVAAHLLTARVQTSMHYPPVHRMTYYRGKFGDRALPETERFCRTELTLPLHPGLTWADVDRVVRSLRDALDNTS
jgi:dTDP-4-amino-4,6-dideoxygalactose transaminase